MSAPTPARRVAYEVLRRVFEHDAYADRSLRSAAARHGVEGGRERALAQRLAYGAVQRRRTCDHFVARLARRRPEKIDPPLLAALRLGLFELLFDDGAAGYAAVDQAVELAKGGRDGNRRHRGAGLVNAVLRRAAREREQLLAGLAEETPPAASIRHSIPEWIAELWWTERGAASARALMAAANVPARRFYRPTAEPVRGELVEAGVELGEPAAAPLDAAAGGLLLEVVGGEWAAVEKAVAEGRLVPQSPGSALVATLLDVGAGHRVLDLCAAPGIKASQLAAMAGEDGALVAVERDPGRARELEELCGRAGVRNVEVRVGDGAELDLGSGYDRVLVDAPCSGLGTLASRPDARWRRRPADLPPLAELQGRLLDAACSALRPGGRAVYSVCTISRAEGEEVVAGLLAERPEIGVAPVPAGLEPLADDRDPRFLQLLPDRDHSDGFFIAALEKRA